MSDRSLDRLPNPVTNGGSPYVPTNAPAVGDLFDLYDFGHAEAGKAKPPNSPARQPVHHAVTHVSNLSR